MRYIILIHSCFYEGNPTPKLSESAVNQCLGRGPINQIFCCSRVLKPKKGKRVHVIKIRYSLQAKTKKGGGEVIGVHHLFVVT